MVSLQLLNEKKKRLDTRTIAFAQRCLLSSAFAWNSENIHTVKAGFSESTRGKSACLLCLSRHLTWPLYNDHILRHSIRIA